MLDPGQQHSTCKMLSHTQTSKPKRLERPNGARILVLGCLSLVSNEGWKRNGNYLITGRVIYGLEEGVLSSCFAKPKASPTQSLSV